MHVTIYQFYFMNILDRDSVQQMVDNMQVMPQQEAIYLLTALSNMATSRDDRDQALIEVVVNDIYEVMFQFA